MAQAMSRQTLRRWGNSLGVRLPAAIAKQARLQEDRDVELMVVDEGVLIRAAHQRLTLEQRLASYQPMQGEPVEAMAWDPIGLEGQQ